MKIINGLLAVFLSVNLMSCSVLPVKTEIRENHFRFENFQSDIGSSIQSIHLMCSRQKPTKWLSPKQYLSGEHELWVEANVSNTEVAKSNKEAFVFFKVALESNKHYMLNRKIEGEKISIWIQDVDTGYKVSEVKTAELKPAVFKKIAFRKKRCASSSV